MEVIAYKHTVTDTEVTAISLLGFKMAGVAGHEHEFVNKHFPNFSLFVFVKEINDLLTPLCLDGIEKIIQFSDAKPPKISFGLLSGNYSDATLGLGLIRIFTVEEEEIVVDHTFFRIPYEYRKRGMAKAVFKILLQQYVNMDVRRIKLHASLDDGGYVWARLFFSADNRKEVDDILAVAKLVLDPEQFNVVKRIYNNYYVKSPEGKAFPMHKWAYLPFMEQVLRGCEWHGTMNLKNPEQFSNFIRYVLG